MALHSDRENVAEMDILHVAEEIVRLTSKMLTPAQEVSVPPDDEISERIVVSLAVEQSSLGGCSPSKVRCVLRCRECMVDDTDAFSNSLGITAEMAIFLWHSLTYTSSPLQCCDLPLQALSGHRRL